MAMKTAPASGRGSWVGPASFWLFKAADRDGVGWEQGRDKHKRMTFDTGAATHVGKVRKRNEDSYLVRPEVGLWAGMGGHNDGDLASQTVIEALRAIGPAKSAAELLTLCENSVAE